MAKKVTAGRDYLGSIAPQFAAINDDVLFGEVWSREQQLSPHDRSMITIAGCMGAGVLDQSLQSHIATAKQNGVTKEEIVEVITQMAFYTGWPKAWAAFQYVLETYAEDNAEEVETHRFGEHYKYDDPDHFNGPVWLREIKPFGDDHYIADCVLFPPGVRNHWHIHAVEQTLFVIRGRGWYVEEGKEPRVYFAR